MSLRGYWRTLSERMDWSPAMRITRFTTTARTGRLTKTSVNFMAASVVFRTGRRVVGGLHVVVHAHGGRVAQLEDARADHLLPGLDAGEDGHLVAAGAAQLHHLLAHAPVALAPGPLELLHHEDGVA